MANPENDTRTSDRQTEEQTEQIEASEDLSDLEPKKDVKGGRLI